MRKVYESFLDLLMGVTRDTFEQPAFDVESVLEMPELHLQSLADMSCFHALYAASQWRGCRPPLSSANRGSGFRTGFRGLQARDDARRGHHRL